MEEIKEIIRGLRKILKDIGLVGKEIKEESLIERKIKRIKEGEGGPYEIIDLFDYDFSFEGDIGINRKKISQDIKKYGIEAIAWYALFHYYTEDEWGIYYDLDGVIYFTEQIFGQIDINLVKKSLNIIRTHEIFHFQTEMAFTIKELLSRLLPFSFHGPLYHDRYKDLEEALATAIMYRRFRGQSKYKQHLSYLLNGLPDGYSNYQSYLSNRRFIEGLSDLFSYLFFSFFYYKSPHPFLGVLFPANYFFISEERVPQRIIINTQYCVFGPRFLYYDGIKINVYTNDHPPPHVHIFTLKDKERGRFLYPTFDPYNGSPLTNDEKKKLERYWKRYGAKIKEKLKQVYPNCEEVKSEPIF